MGMHLRTCKRCKTTMDSRELNGWGLCQNCDHPPYTTEEKKMETKTKTNKCKSCNGTGDVKGDNHGLPCDVTCRACEGTGILLVEPERAMIPAPEFVRGDKVRLKDFYYPEDGECQYHTVTRVRWDEGWWYDVTEINMPMGPKVLERYEG